MSDFLAKLAASKLGGYIAIIGGVVAAFCLTSRDMVIDISPEWGPRFCALFALGTALWGALSRGVADRRNDSDTAATKAGALPGVTGHPRRRVKA